MQQDKNNTPTLTEMHQTTHCQATIISGLNTNSTGMSVNSDLNASEIHENGFLILDNKTLVLNLILTYADRRLGSINAKLLCGHLSEFYGYKKLMNIYILANSLIPVPR